MKLTVRSHQYAVGQGGMHVGRLQLNEAQEFTFLYDCGGKRSLLQDAVNRAFPPDGELDLAILSHLHEDHVRGFDLLATRVKVKTVWIPFIEPLEALLIIAQDLAGGGNGGPPLRQMLLDPAAYFGERGVDEVVIIRPDDDGVGPVVPGGGDTGPSDIEPIFLKPSKPLRGNQSEPPQANATEIRPRAKLLEADPGTVWAAHSSGASLNWMLFPHVSSKFSDIRQGFAHLLLKRLGLERDHPTAQDLANLLSTRGKRSELRQAYAEAGVAGHQDNAISMSLYSGPFRPLKGPNMDELLFPFGTGESELAYRIHGRTLSGILFTGDADLNVVEHWSYWRRAYEPVFTFLGTLAAPHHGSRENWPREMLDVVSPHRVFAAARGSRHHPSQAVISDCRARGVGFLQVNDRLEQEFLLVHEQQT